MQAFQPTHVIRRGGERIPVQLCEGVLYTETEWNTDTQADWEINDKGELTFQGDTCHPAAQGAWLQEISQ